MIAKARASRVSCSSARGTTTPAWSRTFRSVARTVAIVRPPLDVATGHARSTPAAYLRGRHGHRGPEGAHGAATHLDSVNTIRATAAQRDLPASHRLYPARTDRYHATR